MSHIEQYINSTTVVVLRSDNFSTQNPKAKIMFRSTILELSISVLHEGFESEYVICMLFQWLTNIHMFIPCDS